MKHWLPHFAITDRRRGWSYAWQSRDLRRMNFSLSHLQCVGASHSAVDWLPLGPIHSRRHQSYTIARNLPTERNYVEIILHVRKSVFAGWGPIWDNTYSADLFDMTHIRCVCQSEAVDVRRCSKHLLTTNGFKMAVVWTMRDVRRQRHDAFIREHWAAIKHRPIPQYRIPAVVNTRRSHKIDIKLICCRLAAICSIYMYIYTYMHTSRPYYFNIARELVERANKSPNAWHSSRTNV